VHVSVFGCSLEANRASRFDNACSVKDSICDGVALATPNNIAAARSIIFMLISGDKNEMRIARVAFCAATALYMDFSYTQMHLTLHIMSCRIICKSRVGTYEHSRAELSR
jgi:hypothetical protein